MGFWRGSNPLPQLKLLDSIEFLHDILLPKLEIHPVEEDVILHPNCSARKLGLQDKLAAIAQRCARSAVVPLNLDCCAFAGDRGLLYPELTRSATSKEAAEVNAREYGGYYSSNITCRLIVRNDRERLLVNCLSGGKGDEVIRIPPNAILRASLVDMYHGASSNMRVSARTTGSPQLLDDHRMVFDL
jgi:hypothetical protein